MPEFHPLYTIGYSQFSRTDLIDLLKQHSIKALVDVRASPYSSNFPEYNREPMQQALQQARIYYASFSEGLGARPRDPALYTHGAVDFAKLSGSDQFLKEYQRLLNGLRQFALCIMCAQKDPANCHRGLLIARYISLHDPQIPIFHFMPGYIETQAEMDKRILEQHRKAAYSNSLFTPQNRNYEEELADAYAELIRGIAWRRQASD